MNAINAVDINTIGSRYLRFSLRCMSRSHINLWWGDLVISNRTSRHREEQNGEVLAFMIGDTCFAWWSKEQLRRLAERRQQGREVEEAEWSRMKGSPPTTPEPPP
jgi:hypothetical protein